MEKTFLKRFFWFAFAAFLSASIPHVAYFFRAFEPGASGLWDTAYWTISYAIAVSIDVTIFLLSVTVAKLHRSNASGKLIASVWVFIVALAALSWFINWEYATTFASNLLAPVDNTRLAFVGTRIGDINPLIASCFQVLAIAYTWIADKIESNEKPKSADELKREADELEARLEQEKRIAILRSGRNQERAQHATGNALALIGAGKTIVKAAFNREQNMVEEPGKTDVLDGNNREQNMVEEPGIIPVLSKNENQFAPGFNPENEEQNAGITGDKTEGKSPVLFPVLSEQEERDTGELTTLNGYQIIVSWLATGRKSASFEDIAKATGVSMKVLRNRVTKGLLKTAPRNPDLILLTSVLDWLNGSQNGRKTVEVPAVKIPLNQEQTA